MTEFTPMTSTLGGLLLGLSTAVLLLGNGRVAGISGVLGQALWPAADERRSWRMVFLVGLPLGALLVSQATGPLETEIAAGPTLLVVAGILVGFGTRLGNGCTSGHGICGMSRGSVRSLTATLTFIGVAGLVVFVTHHLVGIIQ